MDDSLYFSEQHLATREMVHQFARDEVAPIAAKYDAEAKFPWESIRKMGELGLLGVPWPEELGGAGLDLISYMIVIHELAKVDASHGLTISAHTTLGTSPIVKFGTDEQKKRYVPLLASGRVMGGFGLTEPEAGSDAGGTRTTAVKKSDRYILNGVKRFITHGGVGEIFAVTAVTDPSQGTKGISSFILTKPTNDLEAAKAAGIGHEPSLPAMPGFRAGKKEDKLGWRASDTCELIMEDVEVPAENLLGAEGEGFGNFMRTLDNGRIGIAALSLGIAEGAFQQTLQYTNVRKQFGQAIAQFQGVQFQLSDM
ncbi:MAG TPA: acyl-CoA dehydrogenase family protein, partial [Gemmatimonadaceae bacterium]